jgi:UDP-N-acetylglucosamine 2-epimerase
MPKICVVTGTRAEYGLLYWLMKGIKDDPDLELKIIATVKSKIRVKSLF